MCRKKAVRSSQNLLFRTPGHSRDYIRSLTLLTAVVGGLSGCIKAAETETMQRLRASSSGVAALPAGNDATPAGIARAALLLDPTVREQASRTGASIDQISVERAAFFPSLNLGVVGGTGSAGAGQPDLELSGKQMVLDFGGTKRAVAAADVNLQIQYAKFHQAVDQSLSEALLAYRRVRMLEELSSVRARQLTAMRELYNLISERVSTGASGDSDQLETRNRMERAEFNLLEARMELDETRDRLLRLSGQTRGGSIPPFSRNCRPPAGETPELRIAKLENVKADLNLETAERAHFPQVSLNPLMRAGLNGGGASTGLNLSVDTPLLSGGAIRARENAARNTRQSTAALIASEQRNVELDSTRLQRNISSLTEKKSMLARQIEILKKTRGLFRSQYIELGTREITDLLDAEETLYDREAELVETGFTLDEALVDCAVRNRAIRGDLGISKFQIYGYPLTADGF